MPTADAIMGSNVSKLILVIFPGALGDLICLIPALRALARRHPDATLELMARAELTRFATRRLGVGYGHSIDRRELAQLFSAGPGPIAAEALAFFGSFVHVYSFFAADDERFRAALDAATEGCASCFPFRPPGVGHVAAAYLCEIGAKASPKVSAEPSMKTGEDATAALDCSFELDREDLDLAEDRLAGLGLEVGRFMLVLPGSGSLAKNWPPENFAELAASLATRIRPLVILGPAEAALEPVFTAHLTAQSLPVVGHLDLAEVAAIARLAGCFVGNDSGVSHLAAAAGAPGLAIFGPTDPARWRPLGRTTVIQREPLNALKPKEVEAALVEIIESWAPGRANEKPPNIS
jgi:ADP-heptose:LPS heptosyltransferase